MILSTCAERSPHSLFVVLKRSSGLIAAVLALALLSACASSGERDRKNPFDEDLPRRLQNLDAAELYERARRSLISADYTGALSQYRAVVLRFPFTEYATQAQLDIIYAQYKSFSADAAQSAADRFLIEHPRHPEVAYVQYLKGLASYQQANADAGDWWGLSDPTAYDTVHTRRAFDEFDRLIRRYPDSRFVDDARLRMLHLRERLAQHDVAIVRYYASRDAWVAVSRRAESIIERFQGTSVIPETLKLLEKSYRELALTEQADNTRALAQANFGTVGTRRSPSPEPKAKPSEPDAPEVRESLRIDS